MKLGRRQGGFASCRLIESDIYERCFYKQQLNSADASQVQKEAG